MACIPKILGVCLQLLVQKRADIPLKVKCKTSFKIDKPVNEAELIRKLEGSKQNKVTEMPMP